MFDFDSLTLGEVSTIEDLSGMSIQAIADESMPKGKALAAIYMVYKRRTGDPKYTFNQALAVPLSEANSIFEEATDAKEAELEGEADASETSERD